jgi:hypothetical protein
MKRIWNLWLKLLLLTTWEAEIRRIWAQGNSGKKFTRPPSQKMTGCGRTHLHSHCMEIFKRRMEVHASTDVKVRPSLKNIQCKKG